MYKNLELRREFGQEFFLGNLKSAKLGKSQENIIGSFENVSPGLENLGF